ncbi:hypothetical protein [uncultured Rhodoblastus sp.]|uniref:hypothetical protein n=1 Tax=uncultured Rhodoblastus sp. TaxID=543037 RepID=UPI0025F9C9CF|nr:hypothetical protein [uncultured Rhodoblastus sp.]
MASLTMTTSAGRWLWVGAIAATITFTAIASGSEKAAPVWKQPAPGTKAFLGDDGGGVNTATVCDTADRYRDWLKYEHPPGCQTFQHDLPVVIEVITYNPVEDNKGAMGLPIAKVHIPTKNFVGYILLLSLHPLVPKGTIVNFKKIGNDTLRLFPTARIGSIDAATGLDLGERCSASVISYDPSKDHERDLHVTILDGVHAGQSGWMSSFGAHGDDGTLVDQFFQSVLDNNAR